MAVDGLLILYKCLIMNFYYRQYAWAHYALCFEAISRQINVCSDAGACLDASYISISICMLNA